MPQRLQLWGRVINSLPLLPSLLWTWDRLMRTTCILSPLPLTPLSILQYYFPYSTSLGYSQSSLKSFSSSNCFAAIPDQDWLWITSFSSFLVAGYATNNVSLKIPPCIISQAPWLQVRPKGILGILPTFYFPALLQLMMEFWILRNNNHVIIKIRESKDRDIAARRPHQTIFCLCQPENKVLFKVSLIWIFLEYFLSCKNKKLISRTEF